MCGVNYFFGNSETDAGCRSYFCVSLNTTCDMTASWGAFSFAASSWTNWKEEVAVYRILHCFHWGYKCNIDKNYDTDWIRCHQFLMREFHLVLSPWKLLVGLFTFAFSLIASLAVECFLSINTGRLCLACETSVMQQSSTHFYGPFVFCSGKLCFCRSYFCLVLLRIMQDYFDIKESFLVGTVKNLKLQSSWINIAFFQGCREVSFGLFPTVIFCLVFLAMVKLCWC